MVEAAAEATGTAVVIEGYPPPADTRLAALLGDSGPRRDRGQHPPERLLAGPRREHDDDLRRGRAGRPVRREVRARRAPHGDRRRQPPDARRAHARPTARSCAGPTCCAACSPSGSTIPSLSYLFSGRFVGPTSQSPRVDEGRHESLYELEIAFAELDRLAAEDAIFAVARRPAPAQPARRPVGQHPPRRVLHRQAVQPRVRARPARRGRAARLRDGPPPADGARPGAARPRRWSPASGPSRTRGQLVRWGTELHDRFLLPVVGRRATSAPSSRDLDRGTASRSTPAWLDPFLEFRFPRLGITQRRRRLARAAGGDRAVERARRGAAAASTSRFVDSSLERIQVRLDGLTPIAPRRRPATASPCPLQPDRHSRQLRRRRALPRAAADLGPAPDDRRPLAARVRRRRPLERAGRSAAAPTTSIHPGGRSPTTASRPTPRRPRPAGRAASRPPAARGRRRTGRSPQTGRM